MTMRVAAALSFASGYIALSYEILWYRAFSIAMMGRPQAFGLLLAGYLGGLAAGALLGRAACRGGVDRGGAVRMLAFGFLAANMLGYLFVPSVAWFVTLRHGWVAAVALLVLTAAGLGAIFPLLAQLAVNNDRRVGRGVSYLYVANVAGSTAGTLLTGLVLLDYLSMASLSTLVAVIGVICAEGLFLAAATSSRGRWLPTTAATALVVIGMSIGSPYVFAGVHERLVYTKRFAESPPFVHVIENRHGVIAVTGSGMVYGSGAYDGTFNVDPAHDEKNHIRRAFAVALLHASPRHVLIIGLSTGSWAEVIARHPRVEQVTIVEINPGYLQLLPQYPEVAPLLHDPRVRIVIDDGRRWLARNAGERFDLIVANTTYDWRANATSLLSIEFLDLVRAHLNPGGVYYYNTSGEPRVQRTGAGHFPFAWRVNNMLAVSDAPLVPDPERFRQVLRDYRSRGSDDGSGGPDETTARRMSDTLLGELESRDSLLARTAGLAIVTDDNMGTEWTLPHGVWTH